MSEQKPTVGRMVHYYWQSPNGTPEAAIVVKVFRGDNLLQEVNLKVISPDGYDDAFRQAIPFSPEPKAGHWSWPPRV
jgi:hypothetical protein